jgi:hypothetical protein
MYELGADLRVIRDQITAFEGIRSFDGDFGAIPPAILTGGDASKLAHTDLHPFQASEHALILSSAAPGQVVEIPNRTT